MVDEFDFVESEGSVIIAANDPDYLRCATYVKMREMVDKKTKEQIAEYFDISIRTLERWIAKWRVSGLLPRVRSLLFATLVAEEIHSASDMVSRRWAEVVERQVTTAVSASSDKNSLDAAAWLYENFVKPRMETVEGDGMDEMEYLKALHDKSYNPLAISDIDTDEDDL